MLKGEIIDGVQELVQDSSPAMRGLVGRWVNYVLDDLASRGLLHSLQREESTKLVAGNGQNMNTGRNYDLKSDTDKVITVFVPGWGYPDGVLTKRKPADFLREMLTDGPLLQGRPRIYTVFALRTLRLHPIPSADYAPANPTEQQKLFVHKYKDIAHLTENDEITEITVKHAPMLVAGAYSWGARFDALGDYPTAKQDYERGIVNFFADQSNDLGAPSQVPYNGF